MESYGHTSAHSCHKCPTVLPSSHGRQVSNMFEDFLRLIIVLWLLVSTHPNRMCFNSESSSKAGMGNHIPNHQSRTFNANEKHCFVNPPHRRVPRCFCVHTSTHIKHCCSYSALTQHGPAQHGPKIKPTLAERRHNLGRNEIT